jgi:hypothetical protein
MTRGSRSDVGETRVAQNGYHYTKTETKWRLTHHIIAEKKLGRPLTEDDRVVFIDGDRTNLDRSNIEVRHRTTKALRQKEARLLARIEELQGQLDDVRKQIERKMNL